MARPKAPYVNRVPRKYPHAYGQIVHKVETPSSDRKLLVAFTGKIAAGKGTACDHVLQNLPDQSKGVKMSWADALKIEVYECIQSGQWPTEAPSSVIPVIQKDKLVLPTDPEKISWVNQNKTALRSLLQWWGTEYRRSQDPDYWVKRGVEKVKEHLANGKVCVVNDDTRFPNEANALAALGFTLVRILIGEDQQEKNAIARDGSFNPDMRNHASETSLDNYYHKITLRNTGTIYEFLPRVKAAAKRILNPPHTPREYNCVKTES